MNTEKDVVSVKIDPTRKPFEEVNRLRKLEIDRRAVAPLNTLTEFDPMMRVAIKNLNDAQKSKYPHLKFVPSPPSPCMGQQKIKIGFGRAEPKCPYGVNVTTETTSLHPTRSLLALLARCVYCNFAYTAERSNNLREDCEQSRPAGTCLYRSAECTKAQLEGSDFCEDHTRRYKSDNSNGLGTKKFESRIRVQYEDSRAQGPCGKILTSIGLMEYLETTKGYHKFDAQWKVIRCMEYEGSNTLFYIDTEFVDGGLIEVAIINAAGEKVLDTLVLHEKSWKEIYDEGSDSTRLMMARQKKKFQWDDDWNFPPSATVMDAAQVATLLHAASCSMPEARFVEYSPGNMDTKLIQSFLRDNGGLEHVLGNHRGYGAFPLWQKRLPGFWECSQETIFAFCRPDDPMSKLSHRALVDAKKLRILMRDLFNDSAA